HFFFVYTSCYHQALHSFPTRRSSDLKNRSRQRFRDQVRQRQRLGLGVGERAVREELPAHGHPGLAAQHLPVEHPGPADLVRSARSEEHTSELQSPCNLVCRLLLEKKK